MIVRCIEPVLPTACLGGGLLYLLHDICSHDFRQIRAIPGSVDSQNHAIDALSIHSEVLLLC
jgi:hypothetical protein